MKDNKDIYEALQAIRENTTVNEKPYGFLDRAKDALVTTFGSDSQSAQAQGSAVTKERASQLYNAMKMWVGRKQLNPKNLTLDDISAFLKEFGFKDPQIQKAATKAGLKPNVAAQGKQIDSMMIAISAEIGADGQMPGAKTTASAPAAQQKKTNPNTDAMIKQIQSMDKATQDALIKALQKG